MWPEALQQVLRSPRPTPGRTAAIGQKGRFVSVAESVVDSDAGTNQKKKPNDYLVGVAGFEPATPASRTQCSTGLSHTPTKTAAYSGGVPAPQAANPRDLDPVLTGLTTAILTAGEAAVAAAARALADGGLVAFPTETVYGLGADATNAFAIARLYQAKGRPAFNPLISHVGDLASARAIGRFDATALALAEAFWPGPLTLVLPRAAGCPVADLATAGLETIAIRIPSHPVARAILRAFGRPVVAPSANLSGHVSPTNAAHVQSDLEGRIDLIVDGGPVEVGVESTIVGCFEEPMLLRPGGLPREAIEGLLGRALAQPPADAESDSAQPLAPGMLASHYAPRTRVRLNATSVERGEALLAFGAPVQGDDSAAAVINLSPRRDLNEAAANLFGYLRALDATRATCIAVMAIPEEGLGEAINDRLRRAAVGR
jgi:L-threonylcarbamoyladenylate synthase